MSKRKGRKLPNGVAIPSTVQARPAPKPKSRRRAKSGVSCKGKRRYRDQQEAERALHVIQNRARSKQQDGPVPHRSYDCPACNGWHLTSQKVAPKLMGMTHAVGEPGEPGTSAAKIRGMVERLRAEGLDQRADALEAMLPPEAAA